MKPAAAYRGSRIHLQKRFVRRNLVIAYRGRWLELWKEAPDLLKNSFVHLIGLPVHQDGKKREDMTPLTYKYREKLAFGSCHLSRNLKHGHHQISHCHYLLFLTPTKLYLSRI